MDIFKRFCRFFVIFPLLLLCYFAYRLNVRANKGDQLDFCMRTYAQLGYFSGSVFVAHKGKILLNKGYGFAEHENKVPNTPQTTFNIASVSKSFTGILMALLQEEGRLSIQDPLVKYIPDFPNASNITLHHLLIHTSGLGEFFAGDFLKAKSHFHTLEQVVGVCRKVKPRAKPGSPFEYCNSNYILLSAIIEKVTGKTYEECVRHYITNPLGMRNTGYAWSHKIIPHHATGYAFDRNGLKRADFVDMSIASGTGGLYSCTSDLYLLDRALRNNTLLNPESAHYLFHTCEPMVHGSSNPRYCLGWYAAQGEHEIVGHEGEVDGFSTIYHRYPADDAVIIVMSNYHQASLGLITKIARDLQSILFGESSQGNALPYPQIPFETSRVKMYEGRYVAHGFDLYLKAVDGKAIIDGMIHGFKHDFALCQTYVGEHASYQGSTDIVSLYVDGMDMTLDLVTYPDKKMIYYRCGDKKAELVYQP